MQALISASSSIDTGNATGTTALHLAAEWARVDTVKSLLQARAQPDRARDYGPESPHVDLWAQLDAFSNRSFSVHSDAWVLTASRQRRGATTRKTEKIDVRIL